MKLLIVEDDENNIALFESELAKISSINATFARSRDAAETAIRASYFDLVVIDLKIPAQDFGLDSEVEHGLAVHALVQEHCRGTPVIVFSAYGTLRLVSNLAETCDKHDVWASGNSRSMTSFREKADFAACLTSVRDIAQELVLLSGIEISTGGNEFGFSEPEGHLLRIFGRACAGTNVRVAPLGGGLSSARTLRIEVYDSHGAVTSVAVAKLGSISDVQKEVSRYERCIAPALGVGAFAHLIRTLEAGAGGLGGVFFAFAKGFDRSLLDIVVGNPEEAVAVVQRLEALEKNWTATAPIKKVTVGEIRKALVADRVLDENKDKLRFEWTKCLLDGHVSTVIFTA